MTWWRRLWRLAERLRRRSAGKPPDDATVAAPPAPPPLEASRASGAADPSVTQFAGATGEVIDLVLGLDFGTSCTKAVVRSPFALRARAAAVRWPSGNAEGPYLLPTVLYETSSGYELKPRDATRETHTRLKVALMDDPGSRDARVRAAVYLGLALRSARRWFLDSQREAYGGARLRWALNLGIPSAGYDDERVREAFRAVAGAAWQLSLRQATPTFDEAACVLSEAEKETHSQEPINVVPEIAAEVAGYARSKHRREGLHVMFDVGASTIDICGFVLHSDEAQNGDRYSLLTALVEPLGLHELHSRRQSVVADANERLCPGAAATPSPMGAIPGAGRAYVDDPKQSLCGALDRVDRTYTSECKAAILTVLVALRQRRDPNAPLWKSGLPVFAGGGGGRFGLVKKALDASHRYLVENVVKQGIKQRCLPELALSNSDDVPEEMVGRLDVAFGLSLDSFDIGEIVPPHRIKDVPALPMRPKRDAVGKEQV